MIEIPYYCDMCGESTATIDPLAMLSARVGFVHCEGCGNDYLAALEQTYHRNEEKEDSADASVEPRPNP